MRREETSVAYIKKPKQKKKNLACASLSFFPMVNANISLGESVIKGTKQYKSVHVLLKPIEIDGGDLDRPRFAIAVANGFKGPYIAGFMKSHFKEYFLKACTALSFSDTEEEDEVPDYCPVLNKTLELMAAKVDHSSKSLVQGTSFTVVLHAGDKMFVGSIGDNQTHVITKNGTFMMANAHTPFSSDESRRLGDIGIHVGMKMSKRKNSLCGSVESVVDDIKGDLTITRVIGAREYRKNHGDGCVISECETSCVDLLPDTKDEVRGVVIITRHIWEPKGASMTSNEINEAHNIGRMTYKKSKGTGLANHFATMLTDAAYHKVSQKTKECDSLGCAVLLFK